MEEKEITEKLETIFRNVFADDSLVLTNELSANDVEQWDSLSHMLMIAEVEEIFSIKFKLKDLNKMKNVGDMIGIMNTKF